MRLSEEAKVVTFSTAPKEEEIAEAAEESAKNDETETELPIVTDEVQTTDKAEEEENQ